MDAVHQYRGVIFIECTAVVQKIVEVLVVEEVVLKLADYYLHLAHDHGFLAVVSTSFPVHGLVLANCCRKRVNILEDQYGVILPS